jgi:hypothetical protein
MKKTLLIALLVNVFLLQSQELNWVETYTDVQISGFYDVEFDSQGNIYTMNESAFKFQKLSPSGQLLNTYSFQAAYNYNGNMLGGYDINGIEIDQNDNIYVFGRFNFDINVNLTGGSTILQQHTINGDKDQNTFDAFVVKYNSNMQVQWAYEYGNAVAGQHFNDEIFNLHINPDGKVILDIAGSRDDVDKITAGDQFCATCGAGNRFLWVLNNDGSLHDTYTFGPSSAITVNEFANDSNGNIYISGVRHGNVDFDFSVDTYNYPPDSYNQSDFLVKYDANFNLSWVQAFGNNTYTKNHVVVANDNEIYTMAGFSNGNIGTGTWDIDPSTVISNSSPSFAKVFTLVKYDGNGNVLFANGYSPSLVNTLNFSDLQFVDGKIVVNGFVKYFDSGTYSSNPLKINATNGVYQFPGASIASNNYKNEECFIMYLNKDDGFLSQYVPMATRKKYNVSQSQFDFLSYYTVKFKSSPNRFYTFDGYQHTFDVDPTANVVQLPITDSLYHNGLFWTGRNLDMYVAEFSNCSGADKPTFTYSNDTICNGENLTLTIGLGNLNGNADWTWYESGNTTAIGTGNSINLSLSTNKSIFVKGTGACFVNGIASDTIDFVALISPVITAVTGANSCGSASLTLEATATSGIIKWFDAPFGNEIGTGNTFQTPMLNDYTPYYVQAFEGLCASQVEQVDAFIDQVPSLISFDSDTLCVNGTSNLEAISDFGNIDWFETLSGGTSLAIGNFYTTQNLSATTTYYLELSNGSCVATRIPVEVVVDQMPTVISSSNDTICDSGVSNLEVMSDFGTVFWFDAQIAGNELAQGNNFVTPNISSSTAYFYELRNGTCSTSRSQIFATVFSTPTVTNILDAEKCGEGSLDLSATASMGNLVWYDAATGGNVVNFGNNFSTPNLSITQIYYLKAINGPCQSSTEEIIATIKEQVVITANSATSFCVGEQVVLSSSISSNNSWSTTETSQDIIVTSSGIYSVENNGCVDEMEVIVNPIPNAPIISAGNSTLCEGESTLISANVSTGLAWSTGAISTTINVNQSGTYSVSQTLNGCTSAFSNEITVVVNQNPIISANGNTTFCEGGQVTLSSNLPNNNLWSTFETSQEIVITESGIYELSNNGCMDEIEILVNPIPAAPIISATSTEFCEGESTVISANVSNGLTWSTSETSATINVNQAGTYSATQTVNGCVSGNSNELAIFVNSLPSVSLTDFETVCNNSNLFALSGGLPEGGTYSGNAISNNEFNPADATIGLNTITYSFTDANSCTNSAQATIEVDDCLSLNEEESSKAKIYPNPVNSILFIEINEAKELKIELIDALGKVVHSQTSSASSTSIDVSNLQAGIYMLRINNNYHTEKISVNL